MVAFALELFWLRQNLYYLPGGVFEGNRTGVLELAILEQISPSKSSNDEKDENIALRQHEKLMEKGIPANAFQLILVIEQDFPFFLHFSIFIRHKCGRLLVIRKLVAANTELQQLNFVSFRVGVTNESYFQALMVEPSAPTDLKRKKRNSLSLALQTKMEKEFFDFDFFSLSRIPQIGEADNRLSWLFKTI